MCLGFDSQTLRHKWAEFVGSLGSAPRGFSPGTPVFPSLQKPTYNLIQLDLRIVKMFGIVKRHELRI